MSANQSSSQKSPSVGERLQRKLAKIKADQRKKFLNENIIRLEKNGDLSYEAVRTYSVPTARSDDHPNSYTETPASIKNGQQFEPLTSPSDPGTDPVSPSEVPTPQDVTVSEPTDEQAAGTL